MGLIMSCIRSSIFDNKRRSNIEYQMPIMSCTSLSKFSLCIAFFIEQVFAFDAVIKLLKMSKVVSTKQQLEKLVSLMNANPLMAKGICTKVQSQKKWEEFTRELNCLGPPVRTTAKWIKIWADMKSKTKKRVSHNRAEFRATGGGPNRLQPYTSIEEAIIGLLELESCVNPPGDEFGLSDNVNAQCEVLMETLPTPATPETAEIGEQREIDNVRPESRKRKYTKTDRLKLLEEQTNAQKKFYEAMAATMEHIKRSAEETAKYARRSYYLKEKTNKELLKLKREKLQLLKKKIEK